MAQRTDRKVSGDAPHLPSHGKTSKQLNSMKPGVPEAMPMGDGTGTDYSGANDGSKSAPAAPKGSHKGPKK
jgi:hypothetical protein